MADFGLQEGWQGGGFRSTDRATWAPSPELPDTIWTLAVTPRGIAYMGSSHGVHSSTDGGETWSEFNEGLPQGFVASYLYVAPDGHLYVGTNGAGIFKTAEPVTQAYAKIKELSVKQVAEGHELKIKNGKLIIDLAPSATIEFTDVLGRTRDVPVQRGDATASIALEHVRALTFAVIREGSATRVIKLPLLAM